MPVFGGCENGDVSALVHFDRIHNVEAKGNVGNKQRLFVGQIVRQTMCLIY